MILEPRKIKSDRRWQSIVAKDWVFFFLISRKGEKAQLWTSTDQGSKAGGCWQRVEVTMEAELP